MPGMGSCKKGVNCPITTRQGLFALTEILVVFCFKKAFMQILGPFIFFYLCFQYSILDQIMCLVLLIEMENPYIFSQCAFLYNIVAG